MPGPKNSRQKRNLLRFLWRRHRGKCHWCNKPLVKRENPLPHDAATIDHVLSSAEGGNNTRENVVLACFECNQDRARDLSRRLIEKRKRGELT